MALHHRTIVALAVVVFGASGLLLARQQNPPPRDAAAKTRVGTASIAGTVVTADATPAPVRRARVTVRSDAYGNGWSATTDDDGRFVILDLPADRYTVQATKVAWLAANYGATRPGRPGTPISVAEGQRVDNVRLQMSRGGVLTGVVRNRAGEPMPGVSVSAMRYVFSEVNGERMLVRGGAEATTDDQGTYRCYGLPAGEFVVMANLRMGSPSALTDLRRIGEDEVTIALTSARPPTVAAGTAPAPAAPLPRAPLTGFAPTYWPSTTDLSQAGPIKLGVGEERGGLNVTMDLVPTARIDAIPSVPENGNRQSVQVYLLPQSPAAGAGASGMITGRREADGRFVFNGVAPGGYTLVARAAPAGGAPSAAPALPSGRGGPPSGPLTLYATADLAINGIDQVVPLDLKQGMTVSGRVILEPGDLAPADSTINVSLISMKSGPALSVPPARVDAEGAFRIVGVPPGRYRLEYSAGRELDAWRLISGQVKGREVLDAPIDIRAEEDVSDLLLRFTIQPSELSGRLQTSTGQPATAFSIIVFSASREFWIPTSRRVRSLRPATDGGFSVKGLPAGEYLIAALTDVEPGEWYDPKFLEGLVATSAKVVVRDGVKTVQDLMIK